MDFFIQLPTLQKLFLGSALIGGVLFLLLVSLQIFGGASEAFGDGMEADFGDGDVSDISFKFLSFQGLTAFFMMFGLTGMAFRREFLFPQLISVLGAVVCGLVSVWGIKKLFNIFRGFESSGNIQMKNAIGQEGSVYLGIAGNGVGKVQINIQGRLCTMNAVSTNGQIIESGKQVRVTAISNGNVLKVEPV